MPPYALHFEHAHARTHAGRRARVCVPERRGACNIDKKTEAPNLLRAENEECALHGDPKTHVHQGLMSNWPTSEAARRADRGALTRSIPLEERLDYYTQPAQIKESLTFRAISVSSRSSGTICKSTCSKYWKVTRDQKV